MTGRCQFCRREELPLVFVECADGVEYTLCDGPMSANQRMCCNRCQVCSGFGPGPAPLNPVALPVATHSLSRGLVCQAHNVCTLADEGGCKGDLALVSYLEPVLQVACATHRRRCKSCKRGRLYGTNSDAWVMLPLFDDEGKRGDIELVCPNCTLRYESDGRGRVRLVRDEGTPWSDDESSSDDDHVCDESESDEGDDEVLRCVGCGYKATEDNLHTASLDQDGMPQRVCASCLPDCSYCGHCKERFLAPGQSTAALAADDPTEHDPRIAIPQAEYARMVADGLLGTPVDRLVADALFNQSFYHWHECEARCDTCNSGHKARLALTAIGEPSLSVADPDTQVRDDTAPKAYRLECLDCEKKRLLPLRAAGDADSADADVWKCVSCSRNCRECDMHTVSLDVDDHAVRVCERCKPQCDYCGHCMRRFLPPGFAEGADPDWQRSEPASETARRMSDASDGKLSLAAAQYRYNEKFYHTGNCMAQCTHCYNEAPIERTGEILHIISDPDDNRRRGVKRDIYSCQLVCKDRKACEERWRSSPRVRAEVRAMLRANDPTYKH